MRLHLPWGKCTSASKPTTKQNRIKTKLPPQSRRQRLTPCATSNSASSLCSHTSAQSSGVCPLDHQQSRDTRAKSAGKHQRQHTITTSTTTHDHNINARNLRAPARVCLGIGISSMLQQNASDSRVTILCSRMQGRIAVPARAHVTHARAIAGGGATPHSVLLLTSAPALSSRHVLVTSCTRNE